MVSDNGPQFSASEFSHFCHLNGIHHISVPPYHRSLAERAVQTFKKGFKKQSEGTVRERLSRFLFAYRITPQTSLQLR